MGRLEVKEKQISNHETGKKLENQLSFMDISTTTTKTAIGAGSAYVTGCVFMPDGELVISGVDYYSVKVFTPDFKLKNKIPPDFKPKNKITISSLICDVAVVSKNEVIVTTPNLISLQFLTVSDQIEKGKCIPVGMKCLGIDCKNERFYVTCSVKEY